MTDPQLSLIVTDRIDPRDQVTLMPGTDAVCMCCVDDWTKCRWPFCTPPAPPTKEDE
jgi:hypothetical protein